MKGTRMKLSITLAPEVVSAVDRAAKAVPGGSRSSVIETWLRRASRLNQEDRLRADTIAYYEGRAENERAEDAALAQASSRAARKLEFDDE